MPITSDMNTFIARAGGKVDVETQTLQEDHTLDKFIDKLEELCECKGQGYVKALDYIVELKKQHTLCWDKMWKLKEQLDIANEHCEQWGYKWDEKEEVYVNEDDEPLTQAEIDSL